METMGMDAYMMIGYHDKVSKTVANQSYYSKLEIMFILFIMF